MLNEQWYNIRGGNHIVLKSKTNKSILKKNNGIFKYILLFIFILFNNIYNIWYATSMNIDQLPL